MQRLKKTQRLGDAGVELVELNADLSDTQQQLMDDKIFLVVTLHETIKILNDDDTLELFKRTPPVASLMQLKSSQRLDFNRAAGLFKTHQDVRTDPIMLALRGKKVSMEKAVEMIKKMVKLMAQEQADDETKKRFCETELKETQAEINGLELHISCEYWTCLVDWGGGSNSKYRRGKKIASVTRSSKIFPFNPKILKFECKQKSCCLTLANNSEMKTATKQNVKFRFLL